MAGSREVRPRRGRLEWWLIALLVLAVVQSACWLVPQTRPGVTGAVLWLLGSDLILWAGLALLIGLWAIITSAIRRPFWNHWRLAGYVGLIALAASPMAYLRYPSSHDHRPSAVRFGLPLDGPITVGWGGGTPEVNYHVVAPDQRWAYDLLVTRDGKSHKGDGAICADYYIDDLPVLAPADGLVHAVRDGDPDMPIGELGGGTDPGGNQVILEVASNEYLFLCHLRPGSILVKPGDRVRAGQPLARVGNSGNTSEPHLHIHLQDTPDLGLGEGIPLLFHDYRSAGRRFDRAIPTGGISAGEEGVRFLGEVVEHDGAGSSPP